MEKFRGHKIELLNNVWIFTDTKELVSENWKSRPCGHCNLMNTPEEYDGCFGFIPEALNACCGHGYDDKAYIQFEDRTITGNLVKVFLNNE